MLVEAVRAILGEGTGASTGVFVVATILASLGGAVMGALSTALFSRRERKAEAREQRFSELIADVEKLVERVSRLEGAAERRA